MKNLKSLKKKIDSLGRLRIASDTGISYTMLTRKLNGYDPIHDAEYERIESAIRKHTAKSAAITEK